MISTSRGNHQDRLSFIGLMFSGIIILLFGFLPIMPSAVTRIIRPLFIVVSLAGMSRLQYYPMGTIKIHILYLIYLFFIFLLYPSTKYSIEMIVSISSFILFFLFAATVQWSTREIRMILFSLIIACDIMSVLLIYSNFGMFDESGDKIAFLSAHVNRNTPSYAVSIGTVCSMFCFLYGSKHKPLTTKLYYLGSFALCFYVVFVLACRGAFFSAAIGVMLLIWQKVRENDQKQNRFFLQLLLIVLVALIVLGAMSLSQGTTSERLFQFGDDFDDSGRSELWDVAWPMINAKPIFGGGFDYWGTANAGLGTHNTFMLALLQGGWVGCLLLAFFFLGVIWESILINNFTPLAFFVEVLFHSWAESGMDYFAYIPLTVTFIIINYLKYKQKPLSHIFRH